MIGGGSGGVRASRMAALAGARVAIAEESRMGGTCVIRGCIPKKLFMYARNFSDDFEDAAGYGWTVGETKFDWTTLVANKDKEIARLKSVKRATSRRRASRSSPTAPCSRDRHAAADQRRSSP